MTDYHIDLEARWTAVRKYLSTLKFKTALLPAEISRADALNTGGFDTPKKQGAFRLANGWIVKLYLGKSQRLFATYLDYEYVEALRLADMIKYKFWAHRKRGVRPAADSDFNFSLERAQADCRAESEIGVELTHFEGLLMDAGMISMDPTVDRQEQKTRVSFGRRAAARLETLEAKLNVMSEALDRIERALQPKPIITGPGFTYLGTSNEQT